MRSTANSILQRTITFRTRSRVLQSLLCHLLSNETPGLQGSTASRDLSPGAVSLLPDSHPGAVFWAAQ